MNGFSGLVKEAIGSLETYVGRAQPSLQIITSNFRATRRTESNVRGCVANANHL